MIKVGWNYGSKDKCPVCAEAEDTQDHLFNCTKLDSDSKDVDSDIDTYDMTEHMKKLEVAIRKREVTLEIRSRIKEANTPTD